MSFRLRLAFAAAALTAIVPGLQAQVKISLVAADATIRPGHSFTVALHLVHQPGWHTYWTNPGTGTPTKLDWKLPPGWKEADFEWPAPEVLKDSGGNVVGNGYEG